MFSLCKLSRPNYEKKCKNKLLSEVNMNTFWSHSQPVVLQSYIVNKDTFPSRFKTTTGIWTKRPQESLTCHLHSYAEEDARVSDKSLDQDVVPLLPHSQWCVELTDALLPAVQGSGVVHWGGPSPQLHNHWTTPIAALTAGAAVDKLHLDFRDVTGDEDSAGWERKKLSVEEELLLFHNTMCVI